MMLTLFDGGKSVEKTTKCSMFEQPEFRGSSNLAKFNSCDVKHSHSPKLKQKLSQTLLFESSKSSND
jgi:hypothetical protein